MVFPRRTGTRQQYCKFSPALLSTPGGRLFGLHGQLHHGVEVDRRTVGEAQGPARLVEAADVAREGLEVAAGLPFVRQEAGDGDPGLVREPLPQQSELLVQGGEGILAELRGGLRQPGRLLDLPLDS